MNRYKISCPCHFGLESVLTFEAKKIGAENVTADNGRVTFEGDMSIVARANICLSTAERVLIQLAEFKALSFEDLFQGVRSIPFEEFIGKTEAFPVKGYSLNSQLRSIPDCQSVIKKAAVERMKEKYGVNWLDETGAVHQIQFGIMKDIVTVYLDTSGAGLHKRGYRRNSNLAPIKETLAAGIIDLAHVRENSFVCDPFCGSGTFLIESAYKALGIAPGINRKFSAEKWEISDSEIWAAERKRAVSLVRKDAQFRATGYDADDECVMLSNDNIKKAGVASRITAYQADIRNFDEVENAVVICNPPYGERMLEIKEAEELYKVMGRKFTKGKGNTYYIISPHENFENFFGRPADKRRKLYNGMIKCQLFMYFK
ncbi:MAG: class I SAM-dependent RNA methyltransferase [Oscillospiraceae bacterium]|nr:class I SAM-dependent RNA methyltransferase [Oscillospiraceae bacterium]